MDFFVEKPDLQLHQGVRVDKTTKLSFKNDRVNQSVKDLKLKSKITTKNEQYESVTNLTINLNEGDIVLFEEERGYFLPSIAVESIDESISDLQALNGFKLTIKKE